MYHNLPPGEESRIFSHNSKVVALACPCKFCHIVGRGKEVQGDVNAAMDAHAKGKETGEGGEEKVGGKEKLQENRIGGGGEEGAGFRGNLDRQASFILFHQN